MKFNLFKRKPIINNMEKEIVFEEQEKAGNNSKGYYQFGSNCCIGCKVDRPLSEKG